MGHPGFGKATIIAQLFGFFWSYLLKEQTTPWMFYWCFCCIILILLCLLPGLHSYTYVCLLPVVSGLFDELGCSVRSYYIFNKTVDIYCMALSPLVFLQVIL